ncbi:30S ribosomal protein S15 [Candidatus Portiera aleyrodidarum]|uniref:Small ribosomal subunit protein uS15 n=1 Tax=Candidatus Portiera aleyrodidarum TaxID=91844 RepID=A0A8D9N7Q8_9GAMM|nr:30S ribosomal protein S15 [Candidatus Portiera aleyrodidarum]CEI58551.1 30S ribosomal protein S15 [Candidatus Portiera aleyrodidarum]CEL12267.1 30S ribosomal protein S15 [Candidatus Portiera aleyrodidarum]
MAVNKKNKAAIVNAFGKNKFDTGYPEVQIALLTNNIFILQNHLKKNKYDYHSKRGLIRMVNKRKKLLNYLKIKNQARYKYLIKKINLRH